MIAGVRRFADASDAGVMAFEAFVQRGRGCTRSIVNREVLYAVITQCKSNCRRCSAGTEQQHAFAGNCVTGGRQTGDKSFPVRIVPSVFHRRLTQHVARTGALPPASIDRGNDHRDLAWHRHDGAEIAHAAQARNGGREVLRRDIGTITASISRT
jgi:hypothetical protein